MVRHVRLAVFRNACIGPGAREKRKKNRKMGTRTKKSTAPWLFACSCVFTYVCTLTIDKLSVRWPFCSVRTDSVISSKRHAAGLLFSFEKRNVPPPCFHPTAVSPFFSVSLPLYSFEFTRDLDLSEFCPDAGVYELHAVSVHQGKGVQPLPSSGPLSFFLFVLASFVSYGIGTRVNGNWHLEPRCETTRAVFFSVLFVRADAPASHEVAQSGLACIYLA